MSASGLRAQRYDFPGCGAFGLMMGIRGRGSAGLHVWPASPGPVGVAAGVRLAKTRFNRLFT